MFLLLNEEREALYGGAARGGKSEALLMAAAQYLHVPGYAALLLRRNFPDLMQADGMIPRSLEWWANTDAKWNQTNKRWVFPCPGGGTSTIQFGYCDTANDIYQYQGSRYQFVGWDELTQFGESQYLYLFSRQSKPATGPLGEVPLRMRSGSNPGGVGHDWVKKRFIDPQTRKPGAHFVSAKVADNPSEDQSSYVRSLSYLDPLTRAQLLAGDWDAVAGGRFKRDWWRWYRTDPTAPGWILTSDGERFRPETRPCFQTCDPAASTSAAADYFVLSTWVLTPKANLLWYGCERGKWELPEQVELCQRSYRRHKPQFVAIEEVLNQRGLAQLLRRSTDPAMVVRGVSPLGRDKLARAAGGINLVHSGRVLLPEDNPAFPLDDVMGELERFTGDPKQDAHDDVCLAAGTMIETEGEAVPIEAVTSGARVLTRAGLRRVVAARQTSADTRVLRLELADGRHLIGTPSHQIYVLGKGFVRLDTIEYGDSVLICNQKPNTLSFKAGRTPDTRNRNGVSTGSTSNATTPSERRDSFIGTSGFSTTGQFPRVTTYTTLTATRSTTTPPTCFASLARSTGDSMPSGGRTERLPCWRTWTGSDLLPPLGTEPKRGEHGIRLTRKLHGKIGRYTPSPADTAAVCSSLLFPMRCFAQADARRRQGGRPASMTKTGTVPSAGRCFASTDTRKARLAVVPVLAVREAGRCAVFNIQVEGDHEYFANGILTHNCDTLSYAAELLPMLAPMASGGGKPGLWTPGGPTPRSPLAR